MTNIIPYDKRTTQQAQSGAPIIELKSDSYAGGTWGGGVPKSQGHLKIRSGLVPLLSEEEIVRLYTSAQPIANAIDTVPTEALKRRPEISIENKNRLDPALLKELTDTAHELLVFAMPVVRDCAILAREFGWAIIKLVTDDTTDFSTPAGYRQGVSYIDFRAIGGGACRDTMVHTYQNDPNRRDFGMPLQYHAVPADEYLHHSRVILMQGIKDLRPLKNRSYQLGYSLLEPLAGAWYDYQDAVNSVLKMLEDKSLEVFYIEGFKEMMLKPGGVQRTVNALAYCRKMFGGYVLDSTSKMELLDRTLTGIADTLEIFLTQLSMQANLPDTLLFGRSPSGQTSGEYEKAVLEQLTTIWQTLELEPVYRKILDVFFIFIGLPGINYEINFPKPEAAEKDSAQSEKDRADSIKSFSEALEVLVRSGLISPEIAAELAEAAVKHHGVSGIEVELATGKRKLNVEPPATEPTSKPEPAAQVPENRKPD
jgi:hypothetical protein